MSSPDDLDEFLSGPRKVTALSEDPSSSSLFASAPRPANTMNTRAPTNIHTRLSFDNVNHNRPTAVPQDAGDIPMGGIPRRAALTPPEWMMSSPAGSTSDLYKTPVDIPQDYIGNLRPANSPPLVVPIPSTVTRLTSIDREDLSDSDSDQDLKKTTNSDFVKPFHGTTANPKTAPALTDFNARWSSTHKDMTPLDQERYNDQAMALAAQRIAENKLHRDEQQATSSWGRPEEQHAAVATANSSSQSRLSALTALASRAREGVSSFVVTSPKSEEDLEKEELMRMSQHQRIRAEALKMLQLADVSDVSSPISSPLSDSTPTNMMGSKTHSLYRTTTGGYSSSFGGGGVSESSVSSSASNRNSVPAIVGLGSDPTQQQQRSNTTNQTSNKQLLDKRFSIQEETEYHDHVVTIEEDTTVLRKSYSDNDRGLNHRYSDNRNQPRSKSPVKANPISGENKSRSWSERYSTNRLFMSLNSGMSPNQAQDKIEQEHYNATFKNTSATNMFKSSPHDLDDTSLFGSKQSNEDYSYWYQTRRAPLRTISSFFLNVSSRVHIALSKLLDNSSSVKVPNSPSTSPTSWNRNINLNDQHHDLPTIPFSPKYDDELERQNKRRRFLKWSILFLIIILIIIVASSVSLRKKASQYHGVTITSTNIMDSAVTFYVTSDTPYSSTDMKTLSQQLSKVDARGSSFLIHLGSVGMASLTNCSPTSFNNAASVLRSSLLPVFVIPGDNDWANCPDPSKALDDWMASFVNFQSNNKFKTGVLPAEISNQAARPENFSFLLNGVLFIGLNLISSFVSSTLTLENIQWIEMNLSSEVYLKNEYRSVVLVGHAPISATTGSFFWSILDTLTGLNKPVLYIHANDGSGGWKRYVPFAEYPMFEAVMLQYGGSSRPVKVNVAKGTKNLFNFYR